MSAKYSYRVTWSEDDNEYVGLCIEFPSLSWLSKSQDAAFKGIRKLVADVVKELHEHGEPVPEPLSTKSYSGKLMVKMPPNLHRQLVLDLASPNRETEKAIKKARAGKGLVVCKDADDMFDKLGL